MNNPVTSVEETAELGRQQQTPGVQHSHLQETPGVQHSHLQQTPGVQHSHLQQTPGVQHHHLLTLNTNLELAVSDFNESARMTSEQIKSDLSEMSRITNFVRENRTRTSQTLQNSRNLNHLPKDESHDDDFEKVKKEFNLLNKNFFQCLNSHSKSIRRNLLQINNVVDQHNLQLMPYTSLQRKLTPRWSGGRGRMSS